MSIDEQVLLQRLSEKPRTVAQHLFTLGREVGAIQVDGKVSVSVRLPLPAVAFRAITLFVVTYRRGGEAYTYWLDHWPKQLRKIRDRYRKRLESTFGSRFIGIQSARHVALMDIAPHLGVLRDILDELSKSIVALQEKTSALAALDETVSGTEGALRASIIRHRKRETRLRSAKIRSVLAAGQRLACEVPGCGLDFGERYGALGEGYIQVHHTKPLASRVAASKTKLRDLRLVCPNCHAMIHKGGECRTLRQVSQALRAR